MNPPTRILIQTTCPFVRDFGAKQAPKRLNQVWVWYGVPLLSVCAAIAATFFLSQITKESRSSSVFFLAAVMVSAWYGGLSAGFFAIALSVLSIDFYFLKPITAFALTVYDIPLIIVFCSLAIVISYLVDFRRRAENQLRQTNDELEQKIIERTAELAEANRVKDEFLAMVTHDLRAPLTSMLGWIEIIERDGLKDESVARAVGVIKRNALAQSALVSDLLDLTSMTSGRIKLELKPTDLAQLLNRAKERVRPMTDAKSISFESSVPADLPIVNADANGLTRVLDNLLINAIKFTPNGGMIELNARVERNRAKITVSDTGDGIDAGLLPHVFEPFRQGSDHNQQGGVGLGLAIVKRIVEAHGGAVSAESAGTGEGSTFVVRLPLEDYADEITLVRRRVAGESKEPLLTRDSNVNGLPLKAIVREPTLQRYGEPLTLIARS